MKSLVNWTGVDGYEEGFDKGFTKGHEDGLHVGLQQGIEQGAYQKALETARTMISLGMTKEQIQFCTNLPLDTVEQLAREQTLQ